jgi:septal ring factor EnvC (AmiA/AmiB activator)
MKALKLFLHVCLILSLAGTNLGLAQNKTQLQNKKKKLQNDINYTTSLLKKNKKKQDASLKQIEKLNSNIETRVELVNNYTQELELLTKEINLNQTQVSSLEKQLNTLKKSYSKMVYQAWKTRNSLSTWMFIFSANNFNQAIRRYRYYKQINELRIIQSKSISHSKNDLVNKIGSLKKSKIDKEVTINEKNNELSTLEKQKKEKDDVLKNLKKKEKDLLAQVKKQEKERDALANKINAIVDTYKPVKKKDNKTTDKTTTKTTTNTNTKVTNTQGSSNSSGFESNKGKLSWPVNKGIITSKFGVHQHPVLDKVEVKNDGIDISTDKGSSVIAVYKGTVSGVFKVDGYENVVIIRHGDYLTVYSHLSQTTVSKGSEVSTEQKIGTAATNDEGDTFINFQVRFGSVTQNPTGWLTK